jgi:hypothetical protein
VADKYDQARDAGVVQRVGDPADVEADLDPGRAGQCLEAQRVEVQRRGGAGAPQGVVDVLDGVEELRVDLGAGDGAAVTALR